MGSANEKLSEACDGLLSLLLLLLLSLILLLVVVVVVVVVLLLLITTITTITISATSTSPGPAREKLSEARDGESGPESFKVEIHDRNIHYRVSFCSRVSLVPFVVEFPFATFIMQALFVFYYRVSFSLSLVLLLYLNVDINIAIFCKLSCLS